MPGGHIFHGPLSSALGAERAVLDTPAQSVGRADGGAERADLRGRRGPRRDVTGWGHNAAMALLESLDRR